MKDSAVNVEETRDSGLKPAERLEVGWLGLGILARWCWWVLWDLRLLESSASWKDLSPQ